MAKPMSVTDAALLAESWQLALRAERKSPQTLKAYSDGVRFYLAWCADRDAEPLSRACLNLWVAGLLDAGAAASTARARQLAVRRFAAWLAEEGEIPADPFLGVKSPKLDERVVEPLTDDELRALLKACIPPKGAEPKDALRHRRDEAIVRIMLETGLRAGEVVALEVPDVDLAQGVPDRPPRQGRQGPSRPDRPGGLPRARPLPPAAPLPPTRGQRRPLARRPRQALLLRRSAQDAPRARRRRRDRRLPPAQAPPHRRAPLARRRRLRGRPDGRGRLDPTRQDMGAHARLAPHPRTSLASS